MSDFSFSTLLPDTVLNALENIGILCDGRMLALNSYENRVYQIWGEDVSPLIVKFYRPERWSDAAILEEHTFAQQLTEREIPVVAPLTIAGQTLHHSQGFRFAVFPRQSGRAPELDQPNTLEWMGRFLGRIHAIGGLEPYHVRETLDAGRLGNTAREVVRNSPLLPLDLQHTYDTVALQALQGIQHCFERAGSYPALRLHGDCHAGNVLWTEQGPHFVDFDDSLSGPAVQDLWMLLSGEREEQRIQLSTILAGYEDFFEFDARQLYLIEGLRTLRLLHYAAWLVRRWQDPAFPVAFPWLATPRYWQDHILALREQIANMEEPPLWQVN